MSHSNSTKAVMIALTGNALISVMKFIAAFFTLSASMLAEAIHSSADCLNQIFLLIGKKRSAKQHDELHPFGYGAEEFFWAFMVAILLFFGGAVFSIYEGIHKLIDPHPVQHVAWALIILGISIIIEAKSFYVAYTELRKNTKGDIVKALKKSVDINLIVIIMEDAAALAGLIVAFVFTILALINPIFDGIGSVIIGLILVFVSYSLVNELRKLIVGESMPRKARKTWSEIPYKEIAKQIKRKDYIVGDFGCGENLLRTEIPNTVLAFDHVAIDETVTACDISKLPLADESIDVAVFSLSLMGSNYEDYLKEAYRVLRTMQPIMIAETANQWKDNEDEFKRILLEIGFDNLVLRESDKFIYVTAFKM